MPQCNFWTDPVLSEAILSHLSKALMSDPPCLGCETFYSFYFVGTHSAAGHCATLQLCDLLEEGDWRAVEECQEWELQLSNLRLLCLGLIDKSNQERKKKRTKELHFLSPALFPAHKTSHSQAFSSSFEVFLTNGSFWRSANHIQLFWPSLIWSQQRGSGIQDQGSGSFHKAALVGTGAIAALTNGKAGIKKAAESENAQMTGLATSGIRAPLRLLRLFLPTLSQSRQLCL